MSRTKIGTYRVDNRYKDVVFCHNRPKRHKHYTKKNNTLKVLKFVFSRRGLNWIVLLVSTSIILSQFEYRPISPNFDEVKAEVTPELPITSLTKEQGFEEHDSSREVEARENRAESYEEIIQRYFGDNSKMAIAIAKAESGLNPNAIGDTNTRYHSVGLFQIRLLPERGITKEEMLDPEHNVEYAKMLFDKHGWSPWTVYRTGKYRNYLK